MPARGFRAWLDRFPQIRLNPHALQGSWTKYDIKPIALMTVLRSGIADALWIDSDILITRDFRPIFAGLSSETVAVTEEALCSGHADPDGLRTRLWDLPVGRVMPFTANTGVIRVTQAHLALLDAWNALLQSPTYRSAQALPWDQRGLHVMGDQEVFTALLGSQNFAHLPIRYLRRGTDIVQFFGSSGYTVAERFSHLRHGLPPFIHSQGFRPWWPRQPIKLGLGGRFTALYHELSPYTAAARRHADALDDRDWLEPRQPLAAGLTALGLGAVPLVGLPLALVADGVRFAKHMMGRTA